MARTEFSKATKRSALARAAGHCEGLLASGERCNWPLTIGKVEIDHIIADALGGDASLSNAQCLCPACHRQKTDRDLAIIARAKRRADVHAGIADPHRRKIQGSGFPKTPRRHPATDPVSKPLPPRRPLYGEA